MSYVPLYGRGADVGRARGAGVDLEGGGVGVPKGGVGVGVGVADGVAVAVGVAVVVGVGVGVPEEPTGAWIATTIGVPVLKKPTVPSEGCGG